MTPRNRLRAIAAAALVALAAVVFVWRAPLERAIFAATLDLATGDRVAVAGLHLGTAATVADGVVLEADGAPLVRARRLTVRYDLRELWDGRRRYGLRELDLLEPQLTLRRRADGSFAVGGLQRAGGAGTPATGGAPLELTVRVRDGSVTLRDPYRRIPAARRLSIEAVGGVLRIDSAGRSVVQLKGDFAGDLRQHLTVTGTLDAARRYALVRLQARDVSLAGPANYFINTPSAAVRGGQAEDLAVDVYGFADRKANWRYHVAGSTRISGGTLSVPGMLAPLRDIHGRLDVSDDGLTTPLWRAVLGGISVRLAGGLYDWQAPTFRVGVGAPSAGLPQVAGLFAFSRRLPVAGGGRVTALIEGPTAAPLVFADVTASRSRYAAFPFASLFGRIAYVGDAVDLLEGRAGYSGLPLTVGGVVALGGDAPHSQLVVAAAGHAEQIPYLAELAPGLRVNASLLLTGDGLRLNAAGAVAGTGPGTDLAGILHVDPAGDGTLGPFSLARADGGRLSGAFELHRSTSQSAFWVEAHDYPYAALPARPQLAGLRLTAPTFASRLNGRMAGAGPPSRFRMAGTIAATGLRVGAVTVDTATARVAGAFDAVHLSAVEARGPWGTFAGSGTYAGTRLALLGNYGGSFERLRSLTGDLRARGPVAGPVALLIDPERTIVQVRRAGTQGATVAGLGLEGLDGTISIAGGRLGVYGATARVAHGEAAAAGGFERRRIGLSLGDVAAAGAIRIPGVDPGSVSAIGTVDVAPHGLRFDGGAAVDGARVRGQDALANGTVALSAARLDLRGVDAQVGTTVGTLRGVVAAPGAPQAPFDLAVAVPAAPLGPLLRDSSARPGQIAGTISAAVRVRGIPQRYAIAGKVGAPEGIVNGLPFERLTLRLDAEPGAFWARDGSIVVGSTRAAFAAGLHGGTASARLLLPAANLADFNDFFDAGDTLAGRGRIALAFARRGDAVNTSADIALHGLRYRRFDIGEARTSWTSAGRDVVGSAAFGGPTGTVAAAGALRLPGDVPPSAVVRDSSFSGTAHVRNLDLGVWLPALGYTVPVGGRVDADAALAGPLRNPDIRTTASLRDGSFGTIPVRRLHIEAVSTLHRTTLQSADVSLPGVDLTASGSFGLGLRAPVQLALHATSANLAVLGARFLPTAPSVTGSAEADVRIDGTRANPRIAGGFDVEGASARGVAVPRALGQFSLHGRDVVLSGVEVNFAKGGLELAGSLPFQIAPLGFGPSRAPVALQGELRGIDLSDFAPLLPSGSQLTGALGGTVAIEGTAGAPRVAGAVQLTDGTLRTPEETVPLEAISAQLALAGSTATLERLHAQAGGGTLDASGSATLPSLDRATAGAPFSLALTAHRLTLNSPTYGGGQLDGRLTLTRAAGTRPVIGGAATLSEATIPFSALLLSGAGANVPAALPSLGLDFAVAAGRNVRVRSANVDLGVRGRVALGGTLGAPQLRGRFVSTGGTLTYFNTVFRLVDGAVRFTPDAGLIPTLDAAATTHVIDPDPNTVRNAAGTADVTLNITGPVTNLSIQLSSQPAYDREQILGLLLGAPALGASNLFGETAGSPTLYGSNTTTGLSPAVVGNRNTNGELSVAQEAFGFANAQFTRTLLAPFETSFAQAVGLSNFNVNVDYTGNVGVQGRKIVAKKINALFGTSFGYPYRQTFGFEYKPNAFSAAQLTVFQTLGATGLNSLTPTASITNTSKLEAAQPQSGTAGVSFSLQRLFP